jgi:hypothetical protein
MPSFSPFLPLATFPFDIDRVIARTFIAAVEKEVRCQQPEKVQWGEEAETGSTDYNF